MTTERSTYTYVDGAQETVTLRRSAITPRGYALLTIKSFDRVADCYVNTEWLSNRLDNLDPLPLPPDAITDEMVERGQDAYWGNERTVEGRVRAILTAALTEPPARPEGAEDIERLIRDAENEGQGADNEALANYLAARLTDPTRKEG